MTGELCLVSIMFCFLISFIHDLAETLAGHRASQLMEALLCALMYGYADMENEPLKVSVVVTKWFNKLKIIHF